ASLTSFILTSSAMVPAELSALSLHDALPICFAQYPQRAFAADGDGQPFRLMHAIDEDFPAGVVIVIAPHAVAQDGSFVEQGEPRSEEHTSELQSRETLVCRLLPVIRHITRRS